VSEGVGTLEGIARIAQRLGDLAARGGNRIKVQRIAGRHPRRAQHGLAFDPGFGQIAGGNRADAIARAGLHIKTHRRHARRRCRLAVFALRVFGAADHGLRHLGS
jgi:hypothetical protein